MTAVMTRKSSPQARGRKADSDLKPLVLKGQVSDEMSFAQRVWALTVRIPAGKVSTYGAIAAELGSRSARAVGQALHHNPYAPAVPCHRVVGSDGSLTGFAGGLDKKRRMLQDEGVALAGAKVDLKCLHRFR